MRPAWLSLLSLPLLALVAAALPAPAGADGDAARGGQLVAECKGCHGAAGEGLAESAFPRLAGQQAAYLAKQLQDFAAGTRKQAVMAFFARKMTPQDMADIGAWYASLRAPAALLPAASDTVLARGRALVTQGDTAAGIPACTSCHGPDGKGGLPGVPYIGGQHAEYLAGQLAGWRDGARRNDAGGVMAAVASRLAPADEQAAAAWLARQAPPMR